MAADPLWILQKNYARFMLLEYEIKITPPFDDSLPKQLRELSEAFETQRFKKNVGFIVGSTTGIVAGGLGIAGLALTPFTFGASLGLIIGGVALGVAGAGLNLGFLMESYFKDKGVRAVAEPAINIFMTLRNNLIKLAVYIDAIHEIVDTIQESGGLNGRPVANGVIEINKEDMTKKLDECQDLLSLTEIALGEARRILETLRTVVRTDEARNVDLGLDIRIDEALNFGQIPNENGEGIKSGLFRKISNWRETRRRQAAERQRLEDAFGRLLKLNVVDIRLAPVNLALLLYVFFTEHENFAVSPDENDDTEISRIKRNLQLAERPNEEEKENNARCKLNEMIPGPTPVLTLGKALTILVASSVRNQVMRGAGTTFRAGRMIFQGTARVGRITADSAELGQTVGTTVIRATRGIPVAGIVLSAFGIAFDAASLGLAAHDLHQCRKEVKAHFSQSLCDMAQIMSETNCLFSVKED